MQKFKDISRQIISTKIFEISITLIIINAILIGVETYGAKCSK